MTTRTNRKKPDFSLAVAIPLIILLLALVLTVRFAIAGGDIGCVFAEDPALCAAVKAVGQ